MSNELTKLIEMFPNKEWDWQKLSVNRLITLDYIKEHPEFPWDEGYICFKVNVNPSRIINELNNVDWDKLSFNINLRWEHIAAHLDKPWRWSFISWSPIITEDIVRNNPTLPWNWRTLSKNNNIGWSLFSENLDKGLSWTALSSNKKITFDIIRANKHLPWKISAISANPNITPEIVQKHNKLKWNWFELSRNKLFTFEILKPHLDKKLNWASISFKQDVTIDVVIKYLHYPWHWRTLTRRFAVADIIQYKDLPWDWSIIPDRYDFTIDIYYMFRDKLSPFRNRIAASPGITLDDIRNNPNIAVWKTSLSRNPLITCEYIANDMRGTWNWGALSENRFRLHPFFIKKRVLVYFDKWQSITIRELKIKEQWKAVYESVLDMLRMRIRDIQVGVRASMIA